MGEGVGAGAEARADEDEIVDPGRDPDLPVGMK